MSDTIETPAAVTSANGPAAPAAAVAAIAAPAAAEPATTKGGLFFRRSVKEATAKEAVPVAVAAPKKKRFYQRRGVKLAYELIVPIWIGSSINSFTWNPALNAGAVSFQQAGQGRAQTFGRGIGNFLDSWNAGINHAYTCSVKNMNKDPFPQYDFTGKAIVTEILGAGAVAGNSVMGFFTSGFGTVVGSFYTLPVRPANAGANGPAASNTKECG